MYKMKLMLLSLMMIAGIGIVAGDMGDNRDQQVRLGENLFFDKDLSEPKGQACAACHAPSVGFTGPEGDINEHGAVYEGAVAGRFGNRKPPSAAYAGDSPILSNSSGIWKGGMFWDGRATGSTMGDPLAEQAKGPFLNPLEQNNPDAKAVVDKVKSSEYSQLFYAVCGKGKTTDEYYDCIARSIAKYERSDKVSQFTSKFDKNLKGNQKLSSEEENGLELFRGKAKCDNCHVSTGDKPVFTDFTYDNIGIPKNPENPYYTEPQFGGGPNWTDLGLGGFLKSEDQYGKFKVPTLRNVGKGSCELEPSNPKCIIKAYGHNGYFKSLKEIVHFYNTRDVLPWPAPEISMNVNKAELGNLGLTDTEEKAIVAFLATLSDK